MKPAEKLSSTAILVFRATIKSGIGRFKELELPTHNQSLDSPSDWPDHLIKGSLNCRVPIEGYPKEFQIPGLPPSVALFDEKQFAPAFTIHRDLIGNNKLGPTPQRPDGGDAQVWRAKMRLLDFKHSVRCWLIRRIGSGLRSDLELVSKQHLRSLMGLSDGMLVEIEVEYRQKC